MDELFNMMSVTDIGGASDELLIINPDTRQIELPGSELVFGVEGDLNGERKYFACPRIVGNNIDLSTCFVRANYRNANGDIDFDLIDDLTVSGDNVLFSWEVSGKAVAYKGQVRFNISFDRPGNDPVSWHTTIATGMSLEGAIPDVEAAVAAAADGLAQLLAKVDEQIGWVEAAGEDQIIAVEQAASDAEAASVAEIEAKGENVRASIPDDYTALSEAVGVIQRGMAPGIVCEAEGAAIALDDASNQPVQSLRIFGKSTQDGVPTPDAPVEIKSVESPVVTVCGKNLCNMKAFSSMGSNGTSNTYDAETHTITLNADATSISGRYGSPVKLLPVGQKCTVSFDIRGTSGKIVKCGWDKKKTTITLTDNFKRYSSTMVITVKTEPISFYTELSSLGGLCSGEYMQFQNVQVEYGDTATEYEEYQTAQTLPTTRTLPGIPVTSGGNYTDSDGQQWICDEVDLERGVYVQRINSVTFDGSEAWYISAAQIGVGTRFDLNSKTEPAALTTDCISNRFINAVNASVESCWVLAESPAFRLITEKASTVEELQSYLANNPFVIQYAVLEPIETPLSETELAAWRSLHTNKPNTTILNDAGAHMAVEYVADTKLYIDKKIAALTA